MDKDPDIIKVIVDDIPEGGEAVSYDDSSEISQGIFTRLSNFFGISRGLTAVFCVLFAAIICGSAVLGYLFPKGDETVSRSLDSMRNTDKTYLKIKSDNEAIEKEISSLSKQADEIQQSINDMDKTQDSIDSISQENNNLEKQAENLQNEIQTKQKTLESLEKSAQKNTTSSVVWASGTYTVGKNISAGKYTVTGSGSIVISTSGSARVNTKLKSEGEEYTLSDGDIIKIDGNAKFVSE